MADIDASKTPTARPQPRERGFASFNDAVKVRGASTACFRISGAGRPATAIRASDVGGANLPGTMRLWILRLQ